MKSLLKILILMLTICLLLASNLTFAQEEEEGHIYVLTTYSAVMPDDGTAAERDSLVSVLRDLWNQSDKIISRLELRHYYGSDVHDWVVLLEYENWADIDEANEIIQELIEQKWPNEKERQEFFRRYRRYFTGHSDEIYGEMPQFGK